MKVLRMNRRKNPSYRDRYHHIFTAAISISERTCGLKRRLAMRVSLVTSAPA
jgi:hypothetical protein